MKNILFTLVTLTLLSFSSIGQAPESFKYQAVLRDAGNLILTNQAVGMRITIQQGNIGGTTVYSETFAPITNDFGLVNLNIGMGAVISGTFSTIDWANGPYFIEISVDATGGTSYVVMGTSQLMSVPYALYAKTSGNGQGPQGIPGNDGAIGPQGPIGLTGPAGNDGIDGAPGSTGPQGPIGLTGPAGNDGATGATGPQGGIGPIGLTGPAGNDGVDGAIGATGAQGPIGLTGPQGPAGPVGMSPTLIDADSDTKIQVEESADEDIIRFDLEGTEKWVMQGSRLESVNTGGSLFIGVGAGQNDDLTDNYNIAIGDGALSSNTTGFYNVAIGRLALLINAVGRRNTAIGYNTLISNNDGDYNTAIGMNALYSNTAGDYNTALGSYALRWNTTGLQNTASGWGALYNNTTGSFNTATGEGAMNSNMTGHGNTALGHRALYAQTSGDGNTAIGRDALRFNLTGNQNCANGYYTMRNNTSGNSNTANGSLALYLNTTGSRNSANGTSSLRSNTTGTDNSAYGNNSLYSNTTGNYNTAIGSLALDSNTIGTHNTAIGYASYVSGTDFSNSTALGYNTGITNSNQIHFGNSSITEIKGQVAFTTYSDARIKDNITEDVAGLSFIKLLRPVTYNFNVDNQNTLMNIADDGDYPEKYAIEKIKFSGFLAQEVEQAANQIGYDFSGVKKPKNEHELYGVSYAEFVVPLVKAIQELSEMTENNQKVIAENLELKSAVEENRMLILELQKKLEELAK